MFNHPHHAHTKNWMFSKVFPFLKFLFSKVMIRVYYTLLLPTKIGEEILAKIREKVLVRCSKTSTILGS